MSQLSFGHGLTGLSGNKTCFKEVKGMRTVNKILGDIAAMIEEQYKGEAVYTKLGTLWTERGSER